MRLLGGCFMVKEKPDQSSLRLPELRVWTTAISLGGAVLGVVMEDRTLDVDNVQRFARLVREAVEPVGPAATRLVRVLESRFAQIGCNVGCDRLRTARSANALCEIVAIVSPIDVVDLFEHAPLETSSSAVRTSLASAADVLQALEDESIVNVLERLVGLERDDVVAAGYLQEARMILEQDEMRRSVPLEFRLLMHAASIYVATGREVPIGETITESSQRPSSGSPGPKPSSMAGSSKPRPIRPPSQPTSQPASRVSSSKNPVPPSDDKATLTSGAEMLAPTRVNVERRATGLSHDTARQMIDEAYAEAIAKMDSVQGPMLISLVVTLDVNRSRES